MSTAGYKPQPDAKLESHLGATSKQSFVAHYQATPEAADDDHVHAAITLPASGTTVVTTGITNPDVPRNLTVDGNEADIVGDVVIVGTNYAGQAITETIALNGTTLVAGTKAFKTVSSITVPVRQDADETVIIGVGDILGLPHRLTRNTVFQTFLDGTIEGTPPTVVADADELEKNTVDLNSALAGTQVDIYYLVDGGE